MNETCAKHGSQVSLTFLSTYSQDNNNSSDNNTDNARLVPLFRHGSITWLSFKYKIYFNSVVECLNEFEYWVLGCSMATGFIEDIRCHVHQTVLCGMYHKYW